MTKRDEIITYLSNCQGAELTTILYEVFKQRKESEVIEEGYETKLLFAEASREQKEDTSWSKWAIAAIAKANDSYDKSWKFFNGEPYLQMGKCSSCGHELRSHAKGVECPICNSEAHLT